MITLSTALAADLAAGEKDFVFLVEISGYANAQAVPIVYASAPLNISGKEVRSLALPIRDNASSVSLDAAKATYAGIGFAIQDKDNEITARLDDIDFIGKSVSIKMGTAKTSYADFVNIFLGVITNLGLNADATAYDFQTTDIQENLSQMVFRVAKTKITLAFTETDTVITVESTADFATAGPFSNYETIGARGYLILGSGESAEIIKWTGKTSTTFTGLSRAQLGTLYHAFAIGAEVKEVVIWPGHPLDILAVILTGESLEEDINFETVPSGWKVLETLSIDTASWIEAKDRTREILYEYRTLTAQFIKNFAEGEVMKPLKLFMRSTVGNTIGLVKMIERPIPLAPARQLNREHLKSDISWNGQAELLSNRVTVYYDFDVTTGGFLKSRQVTDIASTARFGLRNPLEISLKGLREANGGADLAELIARYHFLMFAAPHPEIGLSVADMRQLDMEIGDTLRVTHQILPKLSAGSRGVADHFLKILSKAVRVAGGDIQFKLFDADIPASNLYASVAEDGTPDYASATAAQQLERLFIGQSIRAA